MVARIAANAVSQPLLHPDSRKVPEIFGCTRDHAKIPLREIVRKTYGLRNELAIREARVVKPTRRPWLLGHLR